jgi:hypothetical protein
MEADGICGHAGPMTPSIGSLASFGADGRDWRSTAFTGGPWESDGSLALGFFDIADTAVERWKAGRRNDCIVIPIIYNYRHGIELALKEGIRAAAACVRDDGSADAAVQAAEVDKWLSGTHSISKLVNRLSSLLGRLHLGPGNELPAETLDVLGKLHMLDQQGQAFRYSAVKTGAPDGERVLERVRPGEERFDLLAVAEALRDAGTMVLYGVSGVLGDYADYQADTRHAAGL